VAAQVFEAVRRAADAAAADDDLAQAPITAPVTPLSLVLKGTNLQVRVWEALLAMPSGTITSYESLAQAVGAPRAVRAVANAVARNPIHFLIPCHRVVRKSGELGGYAGGMQRKRAMLAVELGATGD
jgi:AraC family transcriptional regulator of adaptative response/methylated-DNA-[protein]-cysteine methyltransferase